MGTATAVTGEMGMLTQLPTVLANAGFARVIIATIDDATERANFERFIRNLLRPTLQRVSFDLNEL
jgi:hypothetical protein